MSCLAGDGGARPWTWNIRPPTLPRPCPGDIYFESILSSNPWLVRNPGPPDGALATPVLLQFAPLSLACRAPQETPWAAHLGFGLSTWRPRQGQHLLAPSLSPWLQTPAARICARRTLRARAHPLLLPPAH